VSDTVGTGMLQIQFGTFDKDQNTFTPNAQKGSQSISIDAAHGSLAGVRDAINAAKVGVTASIVNDGSGHRLIVSSNETGAANGIKISVTDNDGGNDDALGLSQLAYDPTVVTSDPQVPTAPGKNMTQLLAAEDATLIVDGLTIKKSSNTVTDVIEGTTLNLLKTNAGSPTKFSVAADASVATTAVDNFVKAYNELNKTITDLTAYNKETKQAAALQGDAALRSIASDIRNGMTSLVSGAVGAYKGLPQIGLTFDRNGSLQVDSTKLSAALKADPTAVQSLFASAAKTDDSLVKYAGSTANTRAGNYNLNVSQLATQGSAAGIVTAGLTIDSTNDILSMTVNGTSTSVQIAQKTYANVDELVAELTSKLNGSSALKGAGASVSISADVAGMLTVTSSKYGSASTISSIGGSAADGLFGSLPHLVGGVDVAGSLGGIVGVGAGHRLTGTGAADGLKVDILGGGTGQRGTVQYGVGIAGQLDQMMTKLLGSKGLIASKTESLSGQAKQYEADHARLEERLASVKERYTKQFSNLDSQLTAMQQTSAYLAQQLASIAGSRE
jgi:flagellar hook-associated protein 2